MINVPVCIVGCGPIGLAGALLLSRFGIDTLLIERRSEVNSHPRSRFVDTNTMELMRFLGLEKAVEETGLGPDWTAYNRWFNGLTGDQIAAIPSPTFHTVPRSTSPTMPEPVACDERGLRISGEKRPQVIVSPDRTGNFTPHGVRHECGQQPVELFVCKAVSAGDAGTAEHGRILGQQFGGHQPRNDDVGVDNAYRRCHRCICGCASVASAAGSTKPSRAAASLSRVSNDTNPTFAGLSSATARAAASWRPSAALSGCTRSRRRATALIRRSGCTSCQYAASESTRPRRSVACSGRRAFSRSRRATASHPAADGPGNH